MKTVNTVKGGSPTLATASFIRFGPFVLQRMPLAVFRSGVTLSLSSNALRVLECLVLNKGIVSIESLADHGWGIGSATTPDSVKKAIEKIRAALGDSPAMYVRTAPKQGYYLVASPIEPSDAFPEFQSNQTNDALESYMYLIRTQYAALSPLNVSGLLQCWLSDGELEPSIVLVGGPVARRASVEPTILKDKWALRDLLALTPSDHSWITRRWLLRGMPGSGKSVLLKQTAAYLATHRPAIPILVNLVDLLRSEPRATLAETIERSTGIPHLAPALEKVLASGKAAILVDGFDEVPPSRISKAQSCVFMLMQYASNDLVIAGRSSALPILHPDFNICELLPLDPIQQKALATMLLAASGEAGSWTAESVRQLIEESAYFDRRISELLNTPLYFTVFLIVLLNDNSSILRLHLLYERLLDCLLEGRHRGGSFPGLPHRSILRKLLQRLAYDWTVEGLAAESLSDLAGRISGSGYRSLADSLKKTKRWAANIEFMLNDVHLNTGLIGPSSGFGAAWAFLLRLFQDALTAEWISLDLDRFIQGLTGQDDDDCRRWLEPLTIALTRVDRASTLTYVTMVVTSKPHAFLPMLSASQLLDPDDIGDLLGLHGDWIDRKRILTSAFEHIQEQERVYGLVRTLARRAIDGNDLFFLDRIVHARCLDTPSKDLDPDIVFKMRSPAHEKTFLRIDLPRSPTAVNLWKTIPAGRVVISDDERTISIETVKIAIVQVTVGQFVCFDRNTGKVTSDPTGSRFFDPVTNVTWYEASAYCRWLSTQFAWAEGARLPSEGELEYVCLSGQKVESDITYGRRTADLSEPLKRVGTFEPNPRGLYDLTGSVWEWCSGGSSIEESKPIRRGRLDKTSRIVCLREAIAAGTRRADISFRVVIPIVSG